MSKSTEAVRVEGPSSSSTRPYITAVRRVAGDRSGIAAIELATLLPLFVGLVYVIAQIGIYFYFSTTLYYVTGKATRQILTGAIANQGLTAAQYRTQILCPLLPGTMSCSNVITNIQVVPAWSGLTSGGFYTLTNIQSSPSSPEGYTMTGLTPPTMNNSNTRYCIGSAGSIIAAEVYYAMPVLGISAFLPHAQTFNGQSVIFIGATSVFKNEPFTSTYAGC
jgi:pilus assembly protein Flp/PilA